MLYARLIIKMHKKGANDFAPYVGGPTVSSLGIEKTIKPFVIFDNNRLLPYLSTEMQHFDKKQILWAFFVLCSVVARTDLRVAN